MSRIWFIVLLSSIAAKDIAGQTRLTTPDGVGYTIVPDTLVYFADGNQVIFFKGTSQNSWLIILDSLTQDTLEFDKQISKNRSLSVLYTNNKPQYKIYCKGYYKEEARKKRRAERRHNLSHRVPRKLRFMHGTCFFPVFYYFKSAKITRREIVDHGKWKKYSNDTIKPVYALFDCGSVRVSGNVRAKF